MRRRKNNNTIWVLLGGVILVAAIIVGIKEISPSKPSAPITESTPPTPTSTTIGSMSLQGNTVVAQGKNYELSPVNELTSPGTFAIKGKIEQIIPDPTTKSQTPYYFVIQDNGSPVLTGIVVPVGDETEFNVSTFPVGANVLVAGTLFPSVDPTADVFDYSQLLEELHVAPGLEQLDLPPSTPYIGANFNDVAVMG